MNRNACAYCGVRRGVTRDHVVPRSVAKKHHVPTYLTATVPSCFECNIRKGQRRLVPPSWEEHLSALHHYIPGTPWRVWRGGTQEPAYREVHV